MSWWNFGSFQAMNPVNRTEFLDKYTSGEHLSELSDTANTDAGQISEATSTAFENVNDVQAQMNILGQLDGASRHSLLLSMDPVKRDKVLGGSAMDAARHHTGVQYDLDWKNLDVSTKEYTPQKAHAMAIAAKRVYEPLEVVKKEFEAEGFEVQTFDHNGTQAFLATNDDMAILSFRGTEPDQLEDLLTDADGCLKKGYGGKVHTGFSNGLDAVWDDVSKALDKAKVGSDKPLLVTGHSLGAALGTLAAVRLKEEKGIEVNGLYTFGSPRVGNEEFAQNVLDSGLGENTWRFRNNNDGVTRVPPHGDILGYTHVGTEIYFDNEGTANNNLGVAQVEVDRAETFTAVTDYFVKKWNRGHELENLWDHGMPGYVKHVYVNQDFQAAATSRPKK